MIEVEETIYDNGTISYFVKGTECLHREDGPALIYSDGTKKWYLNGKHHREDGPAIEYAHGGKSWWANGIIHRMDGPAVIRSDGKIFWYLNGEMLRDKEKWFEKLPEDQKLKLLYSDYFIGG